MPKRLSLTFACGNYEIVRPLIDGKVEVDGVDLTILTDMDSATRHWRFLRDGEFDAAEVSGSSYLAARDNDWPFRAIPVFLHRRFRHGFMFINTAKGIAKPTDLIGRKIGVKTLMTTAVLWMRGILQHEYGVPLNSIEWFAELEDDVEVSLPKDLKLTRLPHEKSVETMLAEGELDAVLHSDLIKPFSPKIRGSRACSPPIKTRKSPITKRPGIFPIMHVLGLRQSLVSNIPLAGRPGIDENHRLPMHAQPAQNHHSAFRCFSCLIARVAGRGQLRSRPVGIWMTDNENNLETLIGYSHEQGLDQEKT